MKAINKHDNQSVKFPIYCREFGYFEPALFIDTRNGEVYADRAPRNSCSEAEWKGSVKRIVIDGNFIDDDDVSEFIDSQLDIITEYLNSDSEFTDERIIEMIKISSFDWNEERVICESFSDYREFCNLAPRDIEHELNAFNFNVMEYAEDLVSNTNGYVYFKDCTAEELEWEIMQYLNEEYETVFRDECGYHKSLRYIVESNWLELTKADEQKMAEIFFSNDRSIDVSEIYEQIQKVKSEELDYDEFVEGLEL